MASINSKAKKKAVVSKQAQQTKQQQAFDNKPYEDHLSPEVVQRYRDKWYKVHPNDFDEYSREALIWYFNRIKKDIRIPQSKLLHQDVYRRRDPSSKGLMGKMYFYEYEAENPGDAKTGLYDRFPMVFFFNTYVTQKDNKRVLLGLNLHYLEPRERALFLFQLLKFKADKKFKARTRLRLEWQLIKGIAEKHALECVHAYRADRFKSKLIEVHPADWHIAAALQLAKWMKPKTSDQPLATHARKMRRDAKKGL